MEAFNQIYADYQRLLAKDRPHEALEQLDRAIDIAPCRFLADIAAERAALVQRIQRRAFWGRLLFHRTPKETA